MCPVTKVSLTEENALLHSKEMRALILISSLALSGRAGAAVLREAVGLVQLRPAGSERWQPAGTLPRSLGPGDSLRAGFNARLKLDVGGGAFVESAGNAQLSVGDGPKSVNLLFGKLRAENPSGPLELRTPTGVARARSDGLAFRAAVSGGGSSLFEVERGLLGVESTRGGSLLLRAGERVEADLAGLHEPRRAPTPQQARRSDFAERMRRELALERARERPQREAARELRRSEHELGRVLLDASGARVRREEFVTRPGSDRFNYVSLSKGGEGPLSYFSWAGVYDRALPADLSPVFAALAGTSGAASPWTLTQFAATRSNGTDSLVERAIGGHQVDVNSNADPTDDVAGGGSAYRTLFDGYGLYVNGTLKRGFTGSNLQAYSDRTPSTTNDPISGAALGSALPAGSENTLEPSPGFARQQTTGSYGATEFRVDNRALDPEGGTRRGTYASQRPLACIQQSVTASEFGGRSIDVLVDPRVLTSAGGLVP